MLPSFFHFLLKGAHLSLPPVTTAQQSNTFLNATVVTPPITQQTQPPALRSRPAGWHAKTFGFDWNKRADQHKYLVKSGLPEVHAAIVNDDWDLAVDPLFLKHWASVHSPDDVQWLADQVKALSGTLFCCEDISGNSYFYRSAIDGSLDKKFASGNEDLIEWLRSLDVSPGSYKEFESSPFFAAASAASIQTYAKLIDFLYKKSDELSDYVEDDMYGTYGDEDDTSDTSDIFNTSDNEDDDMYRL